MNLPYPAVLPSRASHRNEDQPVNRGGQWSLNASCSCCFCSATPFEKHKLQNGFIFCKFPYLIPTRQTWIWNTELTWKISKSRLFRTYITSCTLDCVHQIWSTRHLLGSPLFTAWVFSTNDLVFCAGSLVLMQRLAMTCCNVCSKKKKQKEETTRNNLKENTVIQRQFSMF